MATYKVLSTKKIEPDLVKEAERNNIELLVSEFIEVTPIKSQEKYEEVLKWVERDKANVVVTSANAANVLCDFLKFDDFYTIDEWKVFCISGKTKETLTSNYPGEINIAATAESSADLAKKIIDKHVKEVVFFCGDKRREELPAILTGKGIKVNEVILYETKEKPVAIKEHFDGIIFFSPSGVNSFFSLNVIGNTTKVFAIGNTTADALKKVWDMEIILSDQSSTKSIVQKVIENFSHE